LPKEQVSIDNILIGRKEFLLIIQHNTEDILVGIVVFTNMVDMVNRDIMLDSTLMLHIEPITRNTKLGLDITTSGEIDSLSYGDRDITV
jgi:hypothetical protein